MRLIKKGALCFGALATLSQAAWLHFDPADTSSVPKLFSQTGFYTNMALKTVTSEAVPYDVNTPLWSDNAAKMRWVLLKPGSAKIQFNPEDDYFGYPDGAVFVQLFMHDTVPGDTTTRIFWETRVLIKQTLRDTLGTNPLTVDSSDIWYPFSYKWNRDGSEAFLVDQRFGLDTLLTLTVNGEKRVRKWTFPSVSNCNQCHRESVGSTQGRSVLGFFTPQLNRPSATNPDLNQILHLFNEEILGWSEPAAPTVPELNAMARWAPLDDDSQPLDLRARSYIAANCSGCHGERGINTWAIGDGELNFDFFKISGGALTPAMELRQVNSGHWGLEPYINEEGDTLLPKLIVPGYPQVSTLLVRMKARNQAIPTGASGDTAYLRNQAQMPPLGVFEVDTTAIRVVTEWITAMAPLTNPVKLRNFFANKPVLQGDMVVLPKSVGGKVMLIGINGRRHELMGISERAFRVPKELSVGIYLLQAGAETFKLVL